MADLVAADGVSRACPICDAASTAPHAFPLRQGGYEIPLMRCRSCGFIYATAKAGDGDRHGTVFHSARAEAVDPVLYTINMSHFLWHWSRRLHWRPDTSILDVGCAEGRMLEIARCMGFRAEGIDISDHYAEQWKARGLLATAGPVERHVAGRQEAYDAIVARAVIEHVAKPLSFLQACAAMLKPTGHCLVETGDASSLQAQVQRSRWGFWIPAEGMGAHVSFLGRRSAAELGRRAGLVMQGSVPIYRYTPFASYVAERPTRNRGPVALAKFLLHRSRLSGGRCLCYWKPASRDRPERYAGAVPRASS